MNVASPKKIAVSDACPICLGDMNEAKKIVITKCTHAFHEQCITFHLNINKITKTTCPYCRQMPIPMVRSEELPDDLETNPYIECKMHRALREGDVDYIHTALSTKPHLIDKLYKHESNNSKHKTNSVRNSLFTLVGKYSLLTLATRFGHQDIVAYLLDKVKPEAINEFSSDGHNALSIACLFGHTRIAELLLNAGAEVNIINSNGKNALAFAASAGKKDIVELLVKSGSSVTTVYKGNTTALFMAAQRGHLEAVDYLISVIPKAELKEQVNICSSPPEPATVLYMAAQEGYADVVSSLLLAGADPNQPIGCGRIPLHAAVLNGYPEMVRLLIASGTNVNYQASNGATALGYATKKGRRKICEYLLKANADPDLGYEDSVSGKQVSAVEIARKNGFAELANYIATYQR